jgi:invasion protein IalB
MRAVIAALLLTFTSQAGASTIEKLWFLHPFGELRSYHGDWLAVCDKEETGNCRLVNYLLSPSDSFYGFDGVLTVGFYIENEKIRNYMDLNAPGIEHPYSTGVVLTFDYIDFHINAEEILSGGIYTSSKDNSEVHLYDVHETFAILNEDLMSAIKNNMKKARWLNFNYRNGKVQFSLRGFSSAYRAVEKLRYSK